MNHGFQSAVPARLLMLSLGLIAAVSIDAFPWHAHETPLLIGAMGAAVAAIVCMGQRFFATGLLLLAAAGCAYRAESLVGLSVLVLGAIEIGFVVDRGLVGRTSAPLYRVGPRVLLGAAIAIDFLSRSLPVGWVWRPFELLQAGVYGAIGRPTAAAEVWGVPVLVLGLPMAMVMASSSRRAAVWALAFAIATVAGSYLESVLPTLVLLFAAVSVQGGRALQPLPAVGGAVARAVGLASVVMLALASSLAIRVLRVDATHTMPQANLSLCLVTDGDFDTTEPGPEDPVDVTSSGANFSEFVALLRRQGVRVDQRSLQQLAADPERRFDALMTINLSGPNLDDDLIDHLRTRVQAGASLVVAGDHTDLFGQMYWTNRLLAGTGTALNFDSIVPQSTRSWSGAAVAGRDELFGPAARGVGLGWSVGASVACFPPAIPLLRATRGFVDKGDRSKPGGLDNLMRDADEPYGGVVLAARTTLGEGDVLVLGDTAVLQNNSVVQEPRFASALCRWLAAPHTVPAAAWGWTGLVAALVGAVIGLLLLRLGLLARFVPLGVLATGLAGASVDVLLANRSSSVVPPPEESAYIDVASMPSFRWDAGLNERADGLFDVLRRAGRRPFLWHDADLPDSGLMVFLDPRRKLSADRWRQLDARIQAGLNVVVFLGSKGAVAMRPMLRELGVGVGQPLGGVSATWGPEMEEGAPVAPMIDCGWDLYGTGVAGAKPLLTVHGRPCAIDFPRGEGHLVLVADPRIALVENSGPKTQTARGFQTLSHLLSQVMER